MSTQIFSKTSLVEPASTPSVPAVPSPEADRIGFFSASKELFLIVPLVALPTNPQAGPSMLDADTVPAA